MSSSPPLDQPSGQAQAGQAQAGQRAGRRRWRSGIEWTDVWVAWVVLVAVLVGVLAGVGFFRPEPAEQLLDAQQQVQQRDESIAELNGRVTFLEAELSRVSPDAVERARREQDLQTREAAVAAREKELEGLWTIPKLRIPQAEEIGRFFGRLTEGFAQESGGGGGDALDRATRP